MRYIIAVFLMLICRTAYTQHQDKVDFIRGAISIKVIPEENKIIGEVIYSFKALSKVDSVYLDAKNMDFSNVTLNDKKVKFNNNGNYITLFKKLKPATEYKVRLVYSAQPAQAVYFIGGKDNLDNRKVPDVALQQVWTQGQGKYSSHWVPSFDDMTEKVEFDLSISADPAYTVIANGKLRNVRTAVNSTTWSFDMDQPMSSYLLAFSMGDYMKKEIQSTGNIPIELYYYPADSLRVEPTFRFTREIFDYLEKEIGVAYPWQNYKQIPVKDFLYAGMENTGTTIFSDSYMIDSTAFVDRNYVNVNAHELAHQWFGNLVTEVDGNHHWLHEGFATYYALLSEKELFGADHFYWKLYESALELDKLYKDNGGEALIDPKASSLTFYEKGAWALLLLQEQLGAANFRKGIKSYLEKYQFQNVTIEDFISQMEIAGNVDLSNFKQIWLQSTEFPLAVMKRYLSKHSESLTSYFELQRELTISSQLNEEIIKKYWEKSESSLLKEQIVQKYHKSLSPAFLKQILAENELKVRQAVATTLDRIPDSLKIDFESMLLDPSYQTIESALYKLWIHHPENRSEYLEQTRDIIGFPNKNVRLLWLLLASLTMDYKDVLTRKEYLAELMNYTSPRYSFEVRQNAFQLIHEVFTFSDENLKDLVNGSLHHSWQFRKFSRELLRNIQQDARYNGRLKKLLNELKGKELRYLSNLLSE